MLVRRAGDCEDGRCPRVVEDTDTGDVWIQGYAPDPVTSDVFGSLPAGELMIRVPRDLLRQAVEAMESAS